MLHILQTIDTQRDQAAPQPQTKQYEHTHNNPHKHADPVLYPSNDTLAAAWTLHSHRCELQQIALEIVA
jgi:hypothetical protein